MPPVTSATQTIEDMPTLQRNFTDYARLNPFFTVSGENEDQDSISVAGRSSRYNNIQIDGAVNNDLFGLADTGTPGGQTDATPISLDAISGVPAGPGRLRCPQRRLHRWCDQRHHPEAAPTIFMGRFSTSSVTTAS